MKLIAYNVSGPSVQDLFDKRQKIKEALMSLAEKKLSGFSFCLKEVMEEQGIIGGTIYQEYVSRYALNRGEDGSFQLAPGLWDSTVFMLDCKNGHLYVEKKRYIGANLKHLITVSRIHEYLNEANLAVFKGSVSLINMIMGVDNEFIRENLVDGKVKSIRVVDLNGKFIQRGTELHNPKEEWDAVWADSWNEYDGNELEEIYLKSKKDHTLKRSVIAKAVLAAGGKPKEALIYDDEEEKYVKFREVMDAHMIVDAILNQDSISKLSQAVAKLLTSRISSKFRLGVVRFEDKPKRIRKPKGTN